jgi:hypothetical protein
MNTTWAAWGPTLVAIVTAIFTAGLLTGRIRNQETTLVEHRKWLLRHDENFVEQGERLARAEAWSEGYAAAKKDGRSHHQTN